MSWPAPLLLAAAWALAAPPGSPPSAGPPGGGAAQAAVPFGPEAVWAVVESHQPELTACYEQRLAEGREIHGEVIVSFVIGTDGVPLKARVRRSTLRDPEVEACALRAVRGWIFPRPSVPQPVELPLRFDEVGRTTTKG